LCICRKLLTDSDHLLQASVILTYVCRWREGTTAECTGAWVSGCRTSLTATASSMRLFHSSFCLSHRAITAPLRPHRARLVSFFCLLDRSMMVVVEGLTFYSCTFLPDLRSLK